MIEVDFIAGFIVCVLSFIAGLFCGRDLGPPKRHGNYEPIEHGDFNESKSWLHPPPWKLGGSVGEKPPTKVIVIHRTIKS